jgi:endoglucanase
MILSIHTYSPFAWAHDGTGSYTGNGGIRTDLSRVNDNATRLRVPVILSEWGSVNNGRDGNLDQRVQHAYDYAAEAREYGMATFWWDSGHMGTGGHGFGLFDRQTRGIHFPAVIDAIMRAYNK